MGIPRLISTLEPFAEQANIRNEDIIIDGPALAYHVLYICRRNGVKYPSYKLIGSTVIAWLDALAMCGLAVQGLYFDGFLPTSKIPVRMERMIKTTSQMNQAYAMSPLGCATRHLIPDEDAEIDLFSLDQPDAKQPLPPSFLVPATIDALKDCPRYSYLVHQVPGEADAFCAKHLAAHAGIVITSDSDLLVHDLGDGRVVFFRDIHIVDKEQQSASCLLYSPRDICQRLHIPPTEIRRLGYEVYRSYNTPISIMASRCKQPVANEKEYTEFCQQYLYEDICPVPKLLDGSALPISRLDPRLSELALQFSVKQAKDESAARMFLPVLIENPMKSSAWEPSTPIRQLAYTVLSWLVPCRTPVQEYRRVQAQQQKGRSVGILSNDAAHEVITDLLKQMARTEGTTKGHVPYWFFLSLTLDIAECERQGKRSHTLQTMKDYAPTSPPKHGSKIPWDTVHFANHIQASYYSLRMLQQILSVTPNALPTMLAAGIKQLQQNMEKFPSLSDFPDVCAIVRFLETSGETGVLGLLGYPIDNDHEDSKATTPPTKSSKKRKKRDVQSVTGSQKTAKPAAPRSKNIFSLLENN